MNIFNFFGKRWVIWLLFIVNVIGTVYGYIWYKPQLVNTPERYLFFVPDSPTASLFFVFVLLAFLLKKNWPLIEALAIVTLFKYGIWAVVMNVLLFLVTGTLHWTGYMLIASHAAMAIQGIIYAPFYKIRLWHLSLAAIWTLHNDVIDYVFGMMPWYGILDKFQPQIGYFTFWLSILSIGITYLLCIYKSNNNIIRNYN